ncbi:MAG TPA: ABC-type transport auxiliary lipoprotein family protein [Arenimonas sp.]|uniref:ABC-type transport auxiliary lipoprotein family protein n=1 Tax=Arenimonas sp. TaxID=1872635 RepID=UPI002D7E701B|nr:ABC-type transport auxiliary lipoprotein family protein [Arenimonas sp.]HEU0154370.1 ABC-type transport auxiliary lipoprotein family protein [Arenimonas sp.]
MSRAILPFAATLLLAGCAAIGGPKTEVRVYAPASSVTVDPAWPAVDWQLSIATSAANQMLDSSRIAVRPTPDRFQVYKGAAWADDAPELLQTALVEGFEDAGKFAAVGRFGGGARGDAGLLVEVRAFETIYVDGRPEAVIEVQARLVQFRGGGPVASKRFRQAVPGTSPEVDDMVAAFGDAMSALTTDLVAWTLSEADRATQDDR